MEEIRFRGGPVAQNSGGMGPDDYLLKPINSGRWTLVIFRFGRNFRWSPKGRIADLRTAQENGKVDREAMDKIFPVQQICVPDNARRFQQLRDRGNMPTMSAAEFWEKHGDPSLARQAMASNNKMGRPSLSKNESTVHKSISMKLSQYLFLKKYGFGNASLGVQRLVDEKRDEEDQKHDS